MKLIPFKLPPRDEDILERMGTENSLFPSAILLTLQGYGDLWPWPQDEIFYGFLEDIAKSGFFHMTPELTGESVFVDVKMWCVMGGGYKHIDDITDMDIDVIQDFHKYYLNTN